MERELWARYYDKRNQEGQPEAPHQGQPAQPGHQVEHRTYTDLSPVDQFEADLAAIDARNRALHARHEDAAAPPVAGASVTPEEALRLIKEARP